MLPLAPTHVVGLDISPHSEIVEVVKTVWHPVVPHRCLTLGSENWVILHSSDGNRGVLIQMNFPRFLPHALWVILRLLFEDVLGANIINIASVKVHRLIHTLWSFEVLIILGFRLKVPKGILYVRFPHRLDHIHLPLLLRLILSLSGQYPLIIPKAYVQVGQPCDLTSWVLIRLDVRKSVVFDHERKGVFHLLQLIWIFNRSFLSCCVALFSVNLSVDILEFQRGLSQVFGFCQILIPMERRVNFWRLFVKRRPPASQLRHLRAGKLVKIWPRCSRSCLIPPVSELKYFLLYLWRAVIDLNIDIRYLCVVLPLM